MKYWMSMLFALSPAMFQTLFASTPKTQCPGMASRTADGPRPHVDCDPTFTEVAVGKVATGPTPQINFPGFAGDRNAVKLMLLRPKLPLPPGVKLGCDTSGMIVRVMRFQSWLKVIGTTGWMLRTFWVLPLLLGGPFPKLVLFWNGTLTTLATGFCAILASISSSFCFAASGPSDEASDSTFSTSAECATPAARSAQAAATTFNFMKCSLPSRYAISAALLIAELENRRSEHPSIQSSN